MKKMIFSTALCLAVMQAIAQLKIDNTVLFIQPGATVTVQGDLTSNVDIQGSGLLLLKGSSLQHVNMGGFSIPNLELDNSANADLVNSDARIGNGFVLTNGKLLTGNFNLRLSAAANISGAGTAKFIWTNGTGLLQKELAADVAAYPLPVGEGNNYRPAFLTTAGSSYSAADFGVRVLGTADPNKPPMAASYLNTTWPNVKNGITGGSVTLEGQYIDPADVAGTEANLFGYYFNGIDWSSVGETHNSASNRVSARVTANSGSLSGINKFLAVGARAFLQGAYDLTASNTGLMFDNLRTLPFGSSASMSNFPGTDPYRVAPYNAVFGHVNNAAVETIPNSAILGAIPVASDRIVDWVFLELRDLNASPGNNILQTRSALIQRDGDIVDVDGISPVTFNNLANGNYILSIRHRNHLGLSIDQSSPRALNETSSTAFTSNVIDMRTASDAQLYGTAAAYTTAPHPSLSTVNLLWGGNTNSDIRTRFTGLNNDRDHLLINSLGNNPANSISNTYHPADVNMNKVVRFTGLNNDRDFILITTLGNNPATVRTQALPN